LFCRGINDWFYRLVYEEDGWDAAFEEWGHSENGWLSIVANLSQLGILLAQVILLFLMLVGHCISSVLLRQMTYDADKVETRLAGSDIFESTMRDLAHLTVAAAFLRKAIETDRFQAGRPDNLPHCLAKTANQLPNLLLPLVDQILEDKTGLLYVHPSHQDRIAAAHRLESPGIFHLERPARILLQDATKLSETATRQHYKRQTGKTPAKQTLTESNTFLTAIGIDPIG